MQFPVEFRLGRTLLDVLGFSHGYPLECALLLFTKEGELIPLPFKNCLGDGEQSTKFVETVNKEIFWISDPLYGPNKLQILQ